MDVWLDTVPSFFVLEGIGESILDPSRDVCVDMSFFTEDGETLLALEVDGESGIASSEVEWFCA